MEEKCGECYHRRFIDGDWMCYCRDSERYAEYTDYEDKCEEFEER